MNKFSVTFEIHLTKQTYPRIRACQENRPRDSLITFQSESWLGIDVGAEPFVIKNDSIMGMSGHRCMREIHLARLRQPGKRNGQRTWIDMTLSLSCVTLRNICLVEHVDDSRDGENDQKTDSGTAYNLEDITKKRVLSSQSIVICGNILALHESAYLPIAHKIMSNLDLLDAHGADQRKHGEENERHETCQHAVGNTG